MSFTSRGEVDRNDFCSLSELHALFLPQSLYIRVCDNKTHTHTYIYIFFPGKITDTLYFYGQPITGPSSWF